jgi:hypothetical protein
MSQPTTHDVYAERYSQPYVPPSEMPTGPTPVPALAVSPPSPVSEKPATMMLADALRSLTEAHEQIAMAESVLAAVAATLAGRS